MTDYSEPLANMAATLSRLTVSLNERRHIDALTQVDDMIRRLQVVRDYVIQHVTQQREDEE